MGGGTAADARPAPPPAARPPPPHRCDRFTEHYADTRPRPRTRTQEGSKHLDLKIAIIVAFEIIFLAGVLVDAFTGGMLRRHGIHPRDAPMGLVGVLFAPFLHKNLTHFLLNMVPFAVLGMLVLLRRSGITKFFQLSAATAVVAGMLVWALGAHGSNHIGSSSLIFSYFGFIVVGGATRGNFRDFIVGIVVFVSYCSLFWGIFPVDEKVSWESHLFGLITGSACALIDTRFGDDSVDQDAVDGEAVDSDDEEQEKLLP